MTFMPLPTPMQGAPLVSDWIRFGPGKTVLVLSGRVELGQGNLTAILEITADEFVIPPSMVAITGTDTARTPKEGSARALHEIGA